MHVVLFAITGIRIGNIKIEGRCEHKSNLRVTKGTLNTQGKATNY